jgi:hypothetical protein
MKTTVLRISSIAQTIVVAMIADVVERALTAV